METPDYIPQRTLTEIADSWRFEGSIASDAKAKLEATLRTLAKPVVLTLLISLALLVTNLIITQHTYSYDSDDVSWQTTIQTWRPFSGQKAYVGAKDNFLINVPFMLVFQHFYHMTRTQLLAEALFFALVNFVLFYISALYFLKKAGITRDFTSLTPFVWLASFGSGFVVAFMNTNWRDYEFGLSFVAYMIAAKYYFDELSPYASIKSKLVTFALFALAVLVTYSDPYFFYFALVPIAAAFVVLWTLRKTHLTQVLTVSGFAFLALVSSRILMSVMARVGILAPQGAISLTSLHNIHATLDQLMQAMWNLFGIDFSQNILVALGNLVLLAVVVAIIVSFVLRLKTIGTKSRRQYDMLRFFGLLGLFSIAAYIAIGNAIVGNGRYLVPFVYVSTLIMAVALGGIRATARHTILIVLVATISMNIAVSFERVQTSANAAATVNLGNYKLISTLKGLGLTKGYTGYWDGDINTFLSKNTVTFLPITCDREDTVPLPLLVNGALFAKEAPKTFLVINSDHALPKVCSMTHILQQFGTPEKTVHEGRNNILVYNYDIYTKMPEQL